MAIHGTSRPDVAADTVSFMVARSPYRPSRDLIVETVRVGVPIETKEALSEAARRAGKSISGFAREAVESAIARQARTRAK